MDKEDAIITWRSIYIANEFNELQAEKREIYPSTTLVWFTFLWLGVGWGNISQTNPDFIILDNDLQPYNMFLKFFLCSFIMWSIVIVQYILVRFRHVVINPTITEFTDLCSVANISILIMTDKVHGYYIHGKAPWSQSDVPMGWLKAQLDKEMKNRAGTQSRSFGIQNTMDNRGNSSQYEFPVTTFEIYLTHNF
jgi:meckelin